MKSKQLSRILVPVISACLFISIVTVAPKTVMGDSDRKGIQTTMGNLYPHQKFQTVAVVSPEEAGGVISTLELQTIPDPQKETSPVTANSPSRSTQLNQVRTQQPSRSSSAVTPLNSTSQPTKASAIIASGKQYIGVKYLFGGTTPSGFDCSGFVQYVFAKNGVSLPRVSRDQFQVGTSISFNNLKPGDLVFFSLAHNGGVDHEGIYVGNGQFINASSSKGVTIYTLGSYWQSAYAGAKRVL